MYIHTFTSAGPIAAYELIDCGKKRERERGEKEKEGRQTQDDVRTMNQYTQ